MGIYICVLQACKPTNLIPPVMTGQVSRSEYAVVMRQAGRYWVGLCTAKTSKQQHFLVCQKRQQRNFCSGQTTKSRHHLVEIEQIYFKSTIKAKIYSEFGHCLQRAAQMPPVVACDSHCERDPTVNAVSLWSLFSTLTSLTVMDGTAAGGNANVRRRTVSGQCK